MSGWIKLHRKLVDWEWYSDLNTFRLFMHLLLTVNYEDKKWKGIEVKSGSKITSLEHLADETSLTVQQVRLSLSKLKTTCEITCKTTNRYSMITLNNWNLYQAKEQANEQSENKQTTTTKEYKNIRSKEYITHTHDEDILKDHKIFGEYSRVYLTEMELAKIECYQAMGKKKAQDLIAVLDRRIQEGKEKELSIIGHCARLQSLFDLEKRYPEKFGKQPKIQKEEEPPKVYENISHLERG
jgi:hypothetical protein